MIKAPTSTDAAGNNPSWRCPLCDYDGPVLDLVLHVTSHMSKAWAVSSYQSHRDDRACWCGFVGQERDFLDHFLEHGGPVAHFAECALLGKTQMLLPKRLAMPWPTSQFLPLPTQPNQDAPGGNLTQGGAASNTTW